MFKTEAPLLFALLAAIVQVGVIFLTDNPVGPDWLLPVFTMLAGLLTRGKVFSEQTVRNAGYTPSEINARAESPTIPTAVGK